MAPYPEEARRTGQEGAVVMRLTIDEQGAVAKATVIQSAGAEFDEAALAAIRQFQFAPATLDGTPVAMDITYTYRFVLMRGRARATLH
jgi:TonB family protein